jgi:hypothetical protein
VQKLAHCSIERDARLDADACVDALAFNACMQDASLDISSSRRPIACFQFARIGRWVQFSWEEGRQVE